MAPKTTAPSSTPSVSPDGVSVPQAYTELTQEAFAFWMRLHHCSDEELRAGRAGLARQVFKMSDARVGVVLRELRLKSYIDVINPGLPSPIEIKLLKRCRIVGRTRFITLSHVAYGRMDDSTDAVVSGRTLYAGRSMLPATVERKAPHHQQTIQSARDASGQVDSLDDHWDIKPHLVMGSFSDHDYREDLSSSSVSLARMKERREEERRAKRVLKSTQPSHPSHGKPIDWSRLDKTGAPVISFTPRPEIRETMISIIRAEHRRLRPHERKVRSSLIAKLRSEFIRIYTRYRRAALMELGASSYHYDVAKEEYKYAEKAALACIMKSVTPTQVLKYWHKNIKNFANKQMQVPPLTFLSQPSLIDQVAIASLSGDESGEGADHAKGWKPGRRRTMWLGDTSVLHPRLRRDLMEAGFDLTRYNDDDIAVIQDYAMDVKSNAVGIKMMPLALRKMIKWALENTLKDAKPEDYLWRG